MLYLIIMFFADQFGASEFIIQIIWLIRNCLVLGNIESLGIQMCLIEIIIWFYSFFINIVVFCVYINICNKVFEEEALW